MKKSLNKSELSETFSVTIRTIDDWTRRGCPHTSKGRKGQGWGFSLPDVVKWRVEYLISTGSSNGKIKSLQGAQLRKTMAEAALKELELSTAMGKLIPKDIAITIIQKLIANCRARLLALPNKLAPIALSTKSVNGMKEIIENGIHDALRELANLNPVDFEVRAETLEPTPKTHGFRMGGPVPAPKSRKQR